MNSKSLITDKSADINKAHTFIKEWKRKRLEDEQAFLNESATPAYKKMMKSLRGKIVKNGIVSAS